jgi:phenazine biosynthesis protein phzE
MLNFDPLKPFGFIKFRNKEQVLFVKGTVSELDLIQDIEAVRAKKAGLWDAIALVPFCQIYEKGVAVERDEPLICLKIEKQEFISLNELKEADVRAGAVSYDFTQAEYENIIKKLISQEIYGGEGANFVVPRTAFLDIENFDAHKAIELFGRLLEHEIGAYMTFLVFTGTRYFIGASPETLINIEDAQVRMQPISGTFRKNNAEDLREIYRRFLDFLRNKKEVNELFMVLDEELKMISQICESGGMIVGPLLKEMSRVIHTEYLLTGHSKMQVYEALKIAMHAPTVVGGPVENAAKIGQKYVKNRSFYGGALALFGLDEFSRERLDTAILIRTADINLRGTAKIGAGATVVKDSDPTEEFEETRAKTGGMINAFLGINSPKTGRYLDVLSGDFAVLEELNKRNQTLSKFWFFNQQNHIKNTGKKGKITIINNEDHFAFMLSHMAKKAGFDVDVVHFENFEDKGEDLVIIGPGPGDPCDLNSPKMAKLRAIAGGFLDSKRAFLGVCLGHQILCERLGFEIVKSAQATQGEQHLISLFGHDEPVGMYNTFYAKYKALEGVEICEREGLVYALRGGFFSGFQFHPESVLTTNGFEILREELIYLCQ